MAAYQGDYYARTFRLQSVTTGEAINIEDWTFEAMFRVNVTDTTPLVTLTTANGGLTVIDGLSGRLRMALTAAQMNLLPEGRVRFDVRRTDPTPGPVWIFGGRIKVKKPVTR